MRSLLPALRPALPALLLLAVLPLAAPLAAQTPPASVPAVSAVGGKIPPAADAAWDALKHLGRPKPLPAPAAARTPIAALIDNLAMVRRRVPPRPVQALADVVVARAEGKKKPVELPEYVVTESTPVRLGFTVARPSTGKRPLVVRDVAPDGIAEAGGLRTGDLIVAINGAPIASLSRKEITAALTVKRGDRIRLTVERAKKDLAIVLYANRPNCEVAGQGQAL